MRSMKFSQVFLSICVVIAILSESTCHVESKAMQQQPLLFGRRGLNPNMNSLFFGKRSSSGLEPLLAMKQVKQACSLITGYIDNIESLMAEEEAQK